jgi:hypothetical protein
MQALQRWLQLSSRRAPQATRQLQMIFELLLLAYLGGRGSSRSMVNMAMPLPYSVVG